MRSAFGTVRYAPTMLAGGNYAEARLYKAWCICLLYVRACGLCGFLVVLARALL